MAMENPFYMWTILEAWEWLINVPVLGFAFLVLLGIFAALFIGMFLWALDPLS